jgi:hypothetical protein
MTTAFRRLFLLVAVIWVVRWTEPHWDQAGAMGRGWWVHTPCEKKFSSEEDAVMFARRGAWRLPHRFEVYRVDIPPTPVELLSPPIEIWHGAPWEKYHWDDRSKESPKP